jgi:quercetin dioxygenase-like cupin family protein|tara:strand:- start:82 stop:375 length:294 start_codon:yes stop_codon:yes gene_type:complete
MYTTSNAIKNQPFDKLQVLKIAKTDNLEVLSISLEKEAIFPEHTSPTDAVLVVLEGTIIFHINENSYKLTKEEHFTFPKKVAHWVIAEENSKFLIIR